MTRFLDSRGQPICRRLSTSLAKKRKSDRSLPPLLEKHKGAGMRRRNPGRPKLGRIRVHVSITPEARDTLFELSSQRGITAGIFMEELIWQEQNRQRGLKNAR